MCIFWGGPGIYQQQFNLHVKQIIDNSHHHGTSCPLSREVSHCSEGLLDIGRWDDDRSCMSPRSHYLSKILLKYSRQARSSEATAEPVPPQPAPSPSSSSSRGCSSSPTSPSLSSPRWNTTN